ncbi:uncharacterized protein CcaverHIS019_0209880 [Cutaneotrichosporon cavernicola]|uniref:Pentacotripeptide-repeat region of PRORP domain-containing protein n=1 Tax=Cutaneotrichosporon cavernicola TaxID=279322 RepID=A0AA48IEB5_9TREE|nr:uncharacterized protein CcaverHIS019_0209880 [Cutaneotrichosporon cavernicola]BEI89626.1 hypothetical protein CcaverHIS019_0209880 [Cutaneotrichosporon cavernicola]BEI97398.1 hypothetical protein CcaverHIS631_0209870 [Cutaneotrichosporon cavernicola]BEJ05175.1 hypothetical protein CcaverHIS641_0209920 [Cutaneotrichosporon cavernicola]
MLRPSFARDIVRLRAARTFHSTLSSRLQSTVLEPVATAEDTAETAPERQPLPDTGLPDPSKFPLYRPPPPPKEREEKIDLANLPTEAEIDVMEKEQITADAIKHVPEYTEDDLRAFYKNVVLSGAAESAQDLFPQIAAPETTTPGQRRFLLGELAKRLAAPAGDAESTVPALPEGVATHMALTAALMKAAPEPTGLTVPLGLVTQSEWRALFDSFLVRSDPTGAEVLLSTMERHGVIPTTDDLNEVIELYAAKGLTSEVARLIEDFEAVGLPVSDFHRDMIIKATLGPDGQAQPALDLLQQAENLGQPFPQTSYNLVLTRLVDGTPTELPDPRTRATALDLFAHMRLAAHPIPSKELFTTMIRLCAAPQDPQPERARDLWLEMIEEHEMQPTAAEYNAIIRALGSTKADYLEAYELLRQMLSMHEEATAVPFEDSTNKLSPWVPTLETFSALLEGTKRAGDLDRARWVLNEMVDLARAGSFSGHPGLQGPDEEMMAHIFQTYAAWRPRVKRGHVKHRALEGKEVAEEIEVMREATGIEEYAAAESSRASEAGVAEEGAGSVSASAEARDSAATSVEARLASEEVAPASSDVAELEEMEGDAPGGPLSRADALREATALFEAILDANSRSASSATNPFRGVKVTTRLINSYLALHMSHSSLESARQTFNDTWAKLETPAPKYGSHAILPNGYTYLGVLERCARGMRKADRALAQEWGREAWVLWRKWADIAEAALPASNPANKRQRFLLGLGERQVEKVWVAAIRLLAIGEDTRRSLSLLDEFVRLYPPESVRDTYSPYIAPEFTIRMTMPDSIGEPSVPPHLMFRDLEVLHNKLVRDENWDGVARIKWACSAYEKGLATRRKWRSRGVGVAREVRQRARERGEKPPPLDSARTQPAIPEPKEWRPREKRRGMGRKTGWKRRE